MKSLVVVFESILGKRIRWKLSEGGDPEEYACDLTYRTGMMWKVSYE
jgi:hypothetical protein